MSALMHQVAYIGVIALMVLVGIGIICVAFAERGPKDTDLPAPEAPTLPPPVIVHLSLWDRIERREPTAQDIEDHRKAWEAFKARQDAIRKVEQGRA